MRLHPSCLGDGTGALPLPVGLAPGACQFVFEHALWWSTLVPHGSGLGVAFVMGIGIVWRLLLFAWSMPLVAHGVPPWGCRCLATGVALMLALGLGTCQCVSPHPHHHHHHRQSDDAYMGWVAPFSQCPRLVWSLWIVWVGGWGEGAWACPSLSKHLAQWPCVCHCGATQCGATWVQPHRRCRARQWLG